MKSYLLRVQFFFCILLLISSCSSSRIVHLNSVNRYSQISPDDVIIYVDEKDIPAQYEKLAIITTNYVSGADKSKWRNVRNKCAKIGANGVIAKMELRATSGARVAAAIFGTVASDKAEFLAIRVLQNSNEKLQPESISNNPTNTTQFKKPLATNNSNKSLLQQKLERQNSFVVGTKVIFEISSKVYNGIIKSLSNGGSYLNIEYTDDKGKSRVISRNSNKVELSK